MSLVSWALGFTNRIYLSRVGVCIYNRVGLMIFFGLNPMILPIVPLGLDYFP